MTILSNCCHLLPPFRKISFFPRTLACFYSRWSAIAGSLPTRIAGTSHRPPFDPPEQKRYRATKSRRGYSRPSWGWSRQFLPSGQYSASASKSVEGRGFLKIYVSDSYSLRGHACNHQDSQIGSGIPWWRELAAVNAI
jgi:hypothetical protein